MVGTIWEIARNTITLSSYSIQELDIQGEQMLLIQCRQETNFNVHLK